MGTQAIIIRRLEFGLGQGLCEALPYSFPWNSSPLSKSKRITVAMHGKGVKATGQLWSLAFGGGGGGGAAAPER